MTLKLTRKVLFSLYFLFWQYVQSQHYFWIDLQKDSGSSTLPYFDSSGYPPSSNIPTGTITTINVNKTNEKLAFDASQGTLTAVAVASSTYVEAYLCEYNVNTCPCGGILAGNYCYKFVLSWTLWGPSIQCPSGSWLAKDYNNIQNLWSTTIQKAHPLDCGGFLIRAGSGCFTYPKSSTTSGGNKWQDTETECQLIGTDWHLATFSSQAESAAFNSDYPKLASICPDYGDLWVGYNSYAWHDNAFATTNYDQPPNWFSLNGGGSGNCVYFDKNSNLLQRSPCTPTKSFVCKNTPLRHGNCPLGWQYIGPYCYMIPSQNYDFQSGKSTCQNNYSDSNLASINSQDEWDNFFTAYMTAQINMYQPLLNNPVEVYIGYQMKTTETSFRNIDGTDDSWTNWVSQPATGTAPASDTCAVASMSDDYKWRAKDCTTPRLIVCKGPVLDKCSDPTYKFVDMQCYKYLTVTATTWDQAARACNQNNGTLPIISLAVAAAAYAKSKDTQLTIWKYFQIWRAGIKQPKDNIWIGLTQYATQGTPLWMTRQTYDAANDKNVWKGGMPDTTTNPYVASNKIDSYAWTTQQASAIANIICHMKKPAVCPSLDFYEVKNDPYCTTNCQYNCYVPSSSTLSFASGEDYCGSRNPNAHLLSYQTTPVLNLYKPLFNIFLAMKYPLTPFWVGYSRGPKNNTGPWVSNNFGTPDATTSMWTSGEPNGDVSDGKKYCTSGTSSSNTLYDDDCTALRGVVCEIDNKNSFCPTGWGEFNGSSITTCYKYFTTADFQTANITCRNNDANLPSFHSIAEWHDFKRYRWTLINTNHDSTATDVWLGLSDMKGQLEWKWSDGSNYNWTHWRASQEPIPAYNPNVAYSPASLYPDNMNWAVSDPTTLRAVICQRRQYNLTNPCVGNFSLVGPRCYMPVTWDQQNYDHNLAQMKCALSGHSLPCFPTSQSWDDFMSWFTNMNQAAQWSPVAVQKTWPMKSFWTGLMAPSKKSYIWDDNSGFNFTYFTPNKGKFIPPACYYANSNETFFWTETICTLLPPAVVPTLICQDTISRIRCTNGYYLSQNNICYWTNTSTKIDAVTARDFCHTNGNGYLPSFHSVDDWTSFIGELNTWASLMGMDITTGVWIGLNDKNISFLWQWDNEMNYNWTNWNPEIEPSIDTSKQCVSAIDTTGKGDWVWQRTACTDQLPVLCQSRPLAKSTCLSGYSDLNGDGKNCYQIVPMNKYNSLTFDRALFYCQSLNGTLPYFDSILDWTDFVAWKNNFDVSTNLIANDFWLGYSAGSIPQWPCLESTVTCSYYSWDTSMPNQSEPSYCAASVKDLSDNWANYDCASKMMQSLICKQKITPSVCPDATWLQVGNIKPICYTTPSPVQISSETNAQSTCQLKGGNLPSFHSQLEYDNFINLYKWYAGLQYNLDTTSGILIGLNDNQKSFLWQWKDSSSYNWNQWETGIEPSSTVSKKCVISTSDSNGNYVWRRTDCSSSVAFVCQIRVPPVTTQCSPGWSDIDGICYRLWPGIEFASWTAMKLFCQHNGGTLPMFTSASQWQAFLDWKENTGRGRNYQSGSFCLDCCKSAPSWTWNNGTAGGTFSNWSNDNDISQKTGQFCAAALVEKLYSWVDYGCTDVTTIDTAICMESFPAPATPCPLPWVGSASLKCFLQLNSLQQANFTNAVTSCQKLNSTLPSFHGHYGWNEDFVSARWYFSAQENLNPITSNSVWIGLTDANHEMVYQYASGDNYNWSHWNPGQQPQQSTNLNCVNSASLQSGPGYWNATDCSLPYTVMCQAYSVFDLCNGIPGWSRIGSRCYQIIPLTNDINFYDANKTCNCLNATLPSFDNVTQWNKFLDWRANFANGKTFNTTDFWLGAQYSNITVQWSWTDDAETSFTAWNSWLSGMPLDSQCGASSFTSNSSWVGKGCYKTLPSLICQLIQYPVDCQMADWVNSSCAETCGNSTLQSTRNVSQINLNGGQPCPNETLIIYECDQIPCPIDCQLAQWQQWGSCDCGASADGLRKRQRTILVPNQFDGMPCDFLHDSGICPELACWPMTKAEKIAALVLQTFGCAWLIGCCALTFISCIVFRIFSLERLLHAGQELCIILTHLFILFLRDDVKDKPVCTVASVFIQFGTIGSFAFMMMEAIQMYCYVTNVISRGNFLSWKFNLLFTLVPPTAITIVSAASFHYLYPARYSCWLNIGNRISATTVVPVLFCSLVTIITLEAAGMGDFRRLRDTDRKKRAFNKVNQRGLLFILPFNIASWLSGLLAVYFQNIGLFTLVFAMFICLGVSIFIFHCLSHACLYVFFGNIVEKIKSKCPCCTKKVEEPQSCNAADHQCNVTDHQPSVHEMHPVETAVEVAPTTCGNNDCKENNDVSMKDLDAYFKWVFDGRADNMNKSEALLF